MKVTFVVPVNNLKWFYRQKKTFGDNHCIPYFNQLSAAIAFNDGIRRAQTEIIVCCHQDVIFPKDWTERLEKQIELIGNDFGVIGTFGVDLDGKSVGHIHGTFEKWINDPFGWFKKGNLPCEVQTLDEHCMVLRKSSSLRFDESLGGWHLYGADICLQSANKGLKNYVIDNCVYHGGRGLANESYLTGFEDVKKKFQEKWKGRNPFSYIKTTCARIGI